MEDMSAEELARARINAHLKETDIDNVQFAQAIKMHPVTLGNKRNGKARFTLRDLEKIAPEIGGQKPWQLICPDEELRRIELGAVGEQLEELREISPKRYAELLHFLEIQRRLARSEAGESLQ